MLKSRTGTERSDQITTWTSAAVAEALLTENSVVNPFGLLRSTSKYGNSSVAAGTASMVQITADIGAARAIAPTSTRHKTTRFIGLLLSKCRPQSVSVEPTQASPSSGDSAAEGIPDPESSIEPASSLPIGAPRRPATVAAV